MGTLSAQTRAQNLKKMQAEPLDLLVIGGGITGAGITLDAHTRGIRVGTLEMRDFSSGTSSRSTKLVHGGLRYLKNLEVKVVAETGRERAIVYENAPHVTTPLRMMLPFYQGGSYGALTASFGIRLYDYLAQVKKSERRIMLSTKQTIEKEPVIKHSGLKGAGDYVEYRTDDSRLTIENFKKAAEKGALIANYAKVTNLLYDENGKVTGAAFEDLVTGETGEIYAKIVVNAAGPWVDDVRVMDHSKQGKHLQLTKGVHLVIDAKKFPLTHAVYFDTPFKDGRMMFAIPREEKVYVGTTDTVYKANPAEPGVTAEDVDYILRAANQMFEISPLTPADVESSWSGVRPLIHEEGKDPSEISRKDEIFHSKSGLYSIAGGKLTGYRHMAKEIVDKVAAELTNLTGKKFNPCATKYLKLSGGDVGGGDGFPEFARNKVQVGVSEYGLLHEEAEKLVHRYGSNVDQVYGYLKEATDKNGLPAIDYAMLHYGLEEEMVMHPLDYMLRRSSQLLFNMPHLAEVKQAIYDEMAAYYDWDAPTKAAMIEEAETQIKEATLFH